MQNFRNFSELKEWSAKHVGVTDLGLEDLEVKFSPKRKRLPKKTNKPVYTAYPTEDKVSQAIWSSFSSPKVRIDRTVRATIALVESNMGVIPKSKNEVVKRPRISSDKAHFIRRID
jgi:hypothetical protein